MKTPGQGRVHGGGRGRYYPPVPYPPLPPRHSQLILLLILILYYDLYTRVRIGQNVSVMKYCSTLEIVFVHFREDFENFILELCFTTI